MQQFLENPGVVAAIISLIIAITAWIQAHTNMLNIRSNSDRIIDLSRQSAKHEEQLNGGFEPRVKATIRPDINAAVSRVDHKIDDVIPKVQ